ncbi:MAG: hypothetical protein IPI38_12100 [Gemmatimonadetes bacterium]|nr:hypothetical protein [Gemmatimonadota bacterium]
MSVIVVEVTTAVAAGAGLTAERGRRRAGGIAAACERDDGDSGEAAQ